MVYVAGKTSLSTAWFCVCHSLEILGLWRNFLLTILYALIAADLFLLFRAGGSARIIYPLILTLFLGALWNYAFFAKENASAGVLILALAVASCIYTVWQAYRKRPLYGWLLLPWLLWQSYALVLNYTIYMIN